jgi:hypothetical protein
MCNLILHVFDLNFIIYTMKVTRQKNSTNVNMRKSRATGCLRVM